MKLFAATLLAAANAQSTAAPDTGVPSWPGQVGLKNIGEACGTVTSVDAKIINSTCEVVIDGGYEVGFISVAGAFWLDANHVTGFDGVSEESVQQVLIFWKQETYATNDTADPKYCGGEEHISFSCKDNGIPDATVNLVGNFIFDPRQTSFQVPVANWEQEIPFELPTNSLKNVWGPNLNATGGCSVIDGTVAGCDNPRGDDTPCDNEKMNCGQLFYFGFDGPAYNSNPK